VKLQSLPTTHDKLRLKYIPNGAGLGQALLDRLRFVLGKGPKHAGDHLSNLPFIAIVIRCHRLPPTLGAVADDRGCSVKIIGRSAALPNLVQQQ
jgi:hypothetical protein